MAGKTLSSDDDFASNAPVRIIIAKIMFAVKIGDASLYSWLHETLFLSWLSPYNASLGFALFHVSINMLVAWILYKKNIFIKV